MWVEFSPNSVSTHKSFSLSLYLSPTHIGHSTFSLSHSPASLYPQSSYEPQIPCQIKYLSYILMEKWEGSDSGSSGSSDSGSSGSSRDSSRQYLLWIKASRNYLPRTLRRIQILCQARSLATRWALLGKIEPLALWLVDTDKPQREIGSIRPIHK